MLLFPEVNTSNGSVTLITVTNTNPTQPVRTRWTYVDGTDCSRTDRTHDLILTDTLTVLANADNPGRNAGYLYVVALDPLTDQPISFNWLVGESTQTNGLSLFDYRIQPFVFDGIGDGQFTDVDGDGQIDLDGVEYSPVADRILIPRFFGQDSVGGAIQSEIILIDLSGGPNANTTVLFLGANDNSAQFSQAHTFSCWTKRSLLDVSNAFGSAFLLSLGDDPTEVLGMPSLETGWMSIDGVSSTSPGGSKILDPAVLGFLVERLATQRSAEPPFTLGTQSNGRLPRGGGIVDCNRNGIPDSVDLANGLPDCNANGVLDECEKFVDCQNDGIPDECELVGNDCNGNGIPDECEPDCNFNGTPDECDLANGAGDCNMNGLLDECELLPDCNGNGLPDDCEFGIEELTVKAFVPPMTTNWTERLFVPRFDPALGQLLSVRFEADATLEGAASAESQDLLPQVLTLDFAAQISLRRPDNSTILTANPSLQFIDNLAPFDGIIDFAGPSGVSYPDLVANETVFSNSPPPFSDLALFSGAGNVVLTAQALGSSSASGPGNLVAQFFSNAGLELHVTYFYAVDCNQNGILDECEIPPDCNGNGIPDDCDPDGNMNGLPDDCEVPTCPVGVTLELWPPNHQYVSIDLDTVAGVKDSAGNPISIQITGITQDEPIDANGGGDGHTVCDAMGVGTSVAEIRAERQGGGNGRVYVISYEATNSFGIPCTGSIQVTVPHSQNGQAAIDDGQTQDSTEGC